MSENPQKLEEFIAALDATWDAHEVWDLSCAFAASHGFDKISYHAVRPLADGEVGAGGVQIKTTGYPQDWLDRYRREELHLVDPITHRAMATTQPFQWSATADMPDLDPKERQFLKDLKAAGVGDGVALQAFGPNLRTAYIGLGFAKPMKRPLSADELRVLSHAAQSAHLAVCRIDDARDTPETLRLTRRETEVLGLIAQGLSTVRIARELGVSRHTVDALQRRIFSKLEVSDRTSAVVRGLSAGLILAPVVRETGRIRR